MSLLLSCVMLACLKYCFEASQTWITRSNYVNFVETEQWRVKCREGNKFFTCFWIETFFKDTLSRELLLLVTSFFRLFYLFLFLPLGTVGDKIIQQHHNITGTIGVAWCWKKTWRGCGRNYSNRLLRHPQEEIYYFLNVRYLLR